MIWTTTPWTLPANVAIAAHPDIDLRRPPLRRPGRRPKPVHTILAADLVAKVMGLRKGVTEFAEVGRCRGKDLEGRPLSPRLPRPRKARSSWPLT